MTCATDTAFARERRRRGRAGADKSPAVGEMAPDFELVTLNWLLMSDKERARAKARSEAEAKRRAAKRGRGRTDKDRAGKDATDKGAADGKPKVEDVKLGHVRLSSFRGKGPVVFVLTSYT